ncbi:UNVERIFIED_ORG: imidazolonepropionase-like amidohydrolase [Arthrobacter sp. UYCu721]
MAPSTATAITNVRVFDGTGLTAPRTVFIENGLISSGDPASADTTIDGGGGTLLPGLIDTHVHVDKLEHLERSLDWGLTTLLDMAAPNLDAVNALRNLERLPDVRSAGTPATAPGAGHTVKMGFPASSTVTGPQDASPFVAARLWEESDYVKVVVENPAHFGPAAISTETVAAIVMAAHEANLLVIAHAVDTAAAEIACAAGVDVLTHAPMDRVLNDHFVARLAERGIVSSPTLTMMRGISEGAFPPGIPVPDFGNARINVAKFHDAGVTILAGSDANMDPGSPFNVPHGESLHTELGLLVEAGLTPAEALRSATSLAAAVFGLSDRGSIEAGRRADLLLVEGDPTDDIAATRNIQGVWIAGNKIR